MCPNFLVYGLLIVLAVWLAVQGQARIYGNAKYNLELVSSFLEQPRITNRFFIFQSAGGYYKGRKAGLAYHMTTDYSSSYYGIFMESRALLKKQPLLLLRYPKPTSNTELRGNRIYYVRFSPFRGSWAGGILQDSIPAFTHEEVTTILRELTEASEIVEAENASHILRPAA